MNRETTDGYGYMIVRVTTARGAIPLKDAVVTVRGYAPELEENRGDALGIYRTNSSGLTDRFALPAPPRALSLSPGNGKSYQTYNLSVDKEGYSSQYFVNVPVFEGITAIQNADMIPLPDNGQTDNYSPGNNVFFETENHALEGEKQPRQGRES